MRILVTGGLGFIGSHYVRTLLDGGYRGFENASVTVLDRVTHAIQEDNIPRSHPRLTFARGSVLDRELLSHVVAGQDAVVHFAAETNVETGATASAVRTNVEGTQALLDACLAAGVARVVHVSTAEVYGDHGRDPRTERSALAPGSPYAASKAASDLLALSYFRTHRLGVSVTRCCDSYGPYQHPDKLVPRTIISLLEGQPVRVGQHVRERLHVAEHCRTVHQVLTAGQAGEVYNIGGTLMADRAIAFRLAELCGADPALIRSATGQPAGQPTARIELSPGLAQTLAWYQDNPQWWKAITTSGGRP